MNGAYFCIALFTVLNPPGTANIPSSTPEFEWFFDSIVISIIDTSDVNDPFTPIASGVAAATGSATGAGGASCFFFRIPPSPPIPAPPNPPNRPIREATALAAA